MAGLGVDAGDVLKTELIVGAADRLDMGFVNSRFLT